MGGRFIYGETWCSACGKCIRDGQSVVHLEVIEGRYSRTEESVDYDIYPCEEHLYHKECYGAVIAPEMPKLERIRGEDLEWLGNYEEGEEANYAPV